MLAATLLQAVTSHAEVSAAPVVPLPPAAAAPSAPPPPAGGQVETDMQANRALGHRLFRLGRYEEAVAAFRRAYELKADARLLYDIAECYRAVGSIDQALDYYDRYLADWPEAYDRDQVEQKVAALSAGRARAAGTLPRKRPVMVAEESAGKQRPAPAPRPWQRWWFWTAIGVALAAGATTAVLSSSPDNALPASDLGSKRFY